VAGDFLYIYGQPDEDGYYEGACENTFHAYYVYFFTFNTVSYALP